MSRLFSGTPLEQPISCERCGRSAAACACPRDRASGKVLDPKAQAIRIRREKRGGKMVTVVSGFAARSARTDDLPAILKMLRGKLGTGGSMAEDGCSFEVQGDHREKVMAALEALGYAPKFAGG